MLLKSLHVVSILLIMMFIVNNSILANGHPKGSLEDTSNVFVSKWHPKMFYVVLPDLSLSFMLPDEPDRTGVHNLFFISKESCDPLLLDTIKYNERYFTPFSPGSCYDAVLLYNNGKYVKCNDIVFENGAEVNMRNQKIQPSDNVSEYWKKTIRTFDRELGRDDMVSEFIIKGYVFHEVSGSSYGAFVRLIGADGKWNASDGYFEIESKDDTEQTLVVSNAGSIAFEKSNIIASCGFIIVLIESPEAKQFRLHPELWKPRKDTQ